MANGERLGDSAVSFETLPFSVVAVARLYPDCSGPAVNTKPRDRPRSPIGDYPIASTSSHGVLGRECTWNGKDLPSELRNLPAGRYRLEPLDDIPNLTEDEEEGLYAALESLHAGKGRSVDEVRKAIDPRSIGDDSFCT